MAQKTAVEWLVFEVFGENARMLYGDLIREAKAMEKEQITDAYIMGSCDMADKKFNPEQYYNETYKK